MKLLLCLVFLGGTCLAANARQAEGQDQSPDGRLRQIILNSRHLGAHGLGYNSQSLDELSRKLTPADIPQLIRLVADREIRIGAESALASQCGAAIGPVRQAAVEHKMEFSDADEVMEFVAAYQHCQPEARDLASSARDELKQLAEKERKKLEAEAQARARDDARIQKNGLKMLDPQQARTLTRQEREEVYRRSLKAMGLREGGPMTPDQKKLVDRMYRTMVLGEPEKAR